MKSTVLILKDFPIAQTVKNLPAMQETQVQLLGQEDPLEKETATHSSILAWEIPWIEEPGGYSPWGHKELDMIERRTLLLLLFLSVQSLSRVRLFVTP